MKIGVHPSNLHLRIAQVWPDAFAALDGEFVAYREGRDTGRLITEGKIDFGGTGSTPPITAALDGLPVNYIAASAPRPANGAILVRTDSPIKSTSDLKGRRIGLVDGSFQTYYLARNLEDAQLSLTDIERIEPEVNDALPALLDGRVDAWIAMAPRLENALERDDIRLLSRCGSTIPNRSLFWTVETASLSADTRLKIAQELARIGREITADPHQAARRLVESGATETNLQGWEKVIASRDFTVIPADEIILTEQQTEAEVLHRHGHFEHLARIYPQAASF
ncbi:ABC transporter substrate-binding protein [Pseudochrobactrum sp. sp1633]|uniref:ABC transporter substrate-binding protein n=1 Tax=Pseudochrobactrum sp. sp1633 TaxID=3036706 RepID=UPI0025A63D8E|nr:ABC transporter substrate-binding protein [Pseudochrobactrum sp. sp1633]MDM8346849.1 ABC transporter substrate-binding protein [Pseudochrobactrum sp. sp1633]HWD12570.1 ABC transporter substrate-binding protein [Pseudochrobactrum sp.]